MKNITTYIKEAQDVETRLNEKIKKSEEKILKLTDQLDKKTKQFDKIIAKYKEDTEVCALIPFEIFNNFKYITYSEQRKLEKEMGVRYLPFPYNIECGNMYYAKGAEIRARHGIEADTQYNGNEDRFNTYENDKDTATLHRFYWDYFTKANELVEGIYKKNADIEEERNKVITVSKQISSSKERAKRISDLFEQVPELASFIEEIGNRQYDFYVKQNENVKKAWEKYNKEIEQFSAEHDYDIYDRQSEAYAKFMEIKKTQPRSRVQTEEEIKQTVERWKQDERTLLAERVLTEFGEVESTSLHVGMDGNVNGTIVGTNKTATIETILAGGYNIQCLHTRLLVHEK